MLTGENWPLLHGIVSISMQEEHLKSLNPSQRDAVLHIQGPLLILAGAGSGKTKTLTHRMLHIVHSGIDPRNILAITFTNKAASEMRERFLSMRSDKNDVTPFIGTFHKILDRSQTKTLLKEAMRRHGYDPKVLDVNKVLAVMSRKKGALVTLKRFIDTMGQDKGDRHFKEAVSEVWNTYENLLEEEGALDFDDLLLKTAVLLGGNEDIRNKYQNLWSHVHIDEYQDTNAVQYEISRLLAQKSRNICAVGDADQSIYSWRGADIKNILNFEEDFKDTRLIKLETNYRSTQNILGAAQGVIKNNKERIDKELFTENAEGEKIFLRTSITESDEAQFVAQKTQELINNGEDPEEIAVLYRTNFQSRALEEAFLMNHIPYQILGTKFFDRAEVKDILAYIGVALNPKSNTDLARIINTPARGIGKVSLLKILEGNADGLSAKAKASYIEFQKIIRDIQEQLKTLPPSELIMHIFDRSGVKESFKDLPEDEREERTLNIAELATLAKRYDHLPPEENISNFLTDAALVSDQDSLDEGQKSVRLMTVHASKGLEFNTVFIVGMEEGLFPYKTMDDRDRDVEEERRLFYVALTRAKKRVILTHAIMRRVFGTRDMQPASSFIDEIDKKHIEYSAETQEAGSIDTQRKKGIADIFDIEF